MNEHAREVARLRENIRKAKAAKAAEEAAEKRRPQQPGPKRRSVDPALASAKAWEKSVESAQRSAKASQSNGRSKSRLGLRGGATQWTGKPRGKADRRFKGGGR